METKKIKGHGDVAWTEVGTEPSSASTEDNVEDNLEHQADISEEGECRKGTWTLEEDRELSRLIEVQYPPYCLNRSASVFQMKQKAPQTFKPQIAYIY